MSIFSLSNIFQCFRTNENLDDDKQFLNLFKKIRPELSKDSNDMIEGTAKFFELAENLLPSRNSIYIKHDDVYIIKRPCYKGPDIVGFSENVDQLIETMIKIWETVYADAGCDKFISAIVYYMSPNKR